MASEAPEETFSQRGVSIEARRALLGAASLVGLAFLFYIPALRAGFIWDDDSWLINNQVLGHPQGLFNAWFSKSASPQYYPMVSSIFWIEHQLWGLHPLGYHAVNILLHGLNAILLWRLLTRLGIAPAWLIAALFCLHPVHVESVAWITERKNVLSGFFYLASLTFYLKSASWSCPSEDHPESASSAHWKWGFYSLALLFFLFALLSKTVTCTLPVVLFLIGLWRNRRLAGSEVIRLAPFFAAGLFLGLVTIWLEKSHVGAQGKEWDFSLIERFLIAGHVFWFYLSKLAAPVHLAFFYPRWDIDQRQAFQYLFPAGVLLLFLFLFSKRRSWGVAPLIAMAFFLVTLFPALGFFSVYPMRYSFVADHFQYLASIGPLALFGATAFYLLRRLGIREGAGKGLGAGVLLALGALTWNQCLIYKDVETLWKDTIAKNPKAWMAYNNLGMEYLNQKRIEEAQQFEASIRVKEDQPEVYYNKGVALVMKGQFGPAIAGFEKSLEIDPTYRKSHINLGNAYLSIGRRDPAIEHYEKALEIAPDALTHFNLANALVQGASHDLAIQHLTEAIRLDPDFAEAHNNLGLELEAKGMLDQAIEHYDIAFRREMGNPTFRANLQRAMAARKKVR